MIFPSQTFILLMAPPAWGKTHLFRQWVALGNVEFLFISPLRALALEVASACPQVQVVLPEEILNWDWEHLAQARPKLVVVWDEIHLVPEWGQTFRHAILEAWYGFCISGLTGVGLTATCTPATREFLLATLPEKHLHLITGDAGNFRFKYHPTRWWWGKREWVAEVLQEPWVGRTLVFCHHRHEVDHWCQLLHRAGKTVWGCKGGETAAFQERLMTKTWPDIIVATSCLSHGVNLPSLSRVVLLDQAAPVWLLHQMRTRAGRRGEPFEIWLSWGVKGMPSRQLPGALLRAWNSAMMARVRQHWRAWCDGP